MPDDFYSVFLLCVLCASAVNFYGIWRENFESASECFRPTIHEGAACKIIAEARRLRDNGALVERILFMPDGENELCGK